MGKAWCKLLVCSLVRMGALWRGKIFHSFLNSLNTFQFLVGARVLFSIQLFFPGLSPSCSCDGFSCFSPGCLCWCGVITQTMPTPQDILCQSSSDSTGWTWGLFLKTLPFHPISPRTVWCFPACPFDFVAHIPSPSLPRSAELLAPGGVSPHLSCYFRFLLLDSCAALNVSGMLSQGDSTTRRLGEVERFDFLCQKNVISHTLGCLTFLFAASKSQEPY